MPSGTKRVWSAGLKGRLTAQHQRRKAALASAGITKITLSKGGVTESRRMDLSQRGARQVHSMAYWTTWLAREAQVGPGHAHRLLSLLESRYIYPASFVIDGKLFWAQEDAETLLRLAHAYRRCNADDDAFIASPFVRTFRRTLRKKTLESSTQQ